MCEVRHCGAAFLDEPSLERHHRTGLHHAELYCYPCDQHFRSFESLQNHLKAAEKHETNKDATKCEHCEQLFLKEFTLVKHEESCEANWYVCQVNGCPFNDKSDSVDLHIARVHDGAKLKERVIGRKAAVKTEGGDVSQPGHIDLTTQTSPMDARMVQHRSITVQTDESLPPKLSTIPFKFRIESNNQEQRESAEQSLSHQQAHSRSYTGQRTALQTEELRFKATQTPTRTDTVSEAIPFNREQKFGPRQEQAFSQDKKEKVFGPTVISVYFC